MSGGGSSGSQTPSVQNSTTVNSRPGWFNDLLQSQANSVGALNNQLPQIQSNFFGGGQAPVGGVYGGGQTQQQPVQAQQPLPIPIATMGGIKPPLPGPTSPGGFPMQSPYPSNQGMGSGIGSSYTAPSGALSSLTKGA